MDNLLDLWDGRFDRAEQRLLGGDAEQAKDQAYAEEAQSADTLQQTWQGQVYWLKRERGQMSDLFHSNVADQIQNRLYFPIWQAAVILAQCDLKAYDSADAMLRQLARDTSDFTAFPSHGWTPSVMALLADACLALSLPPGGGEPHPLAGRVRDILHRYAGEFVLAGWPAVLLGPAVRFEGVAATAMGDYDTAARLFAQASDTVGGTAPQAARLSLDQGRALVLRDGVTLEATALLNRAKTRAVALGMTPISDAADQLLGTA